ncbi:MAG: helix-turn-helix domain-containing protein [Candidatus Binatia bacterium]|nr:helix-turn-helix domain-containing protein [Candidatus Binatia bacterium]
MTEEVAALLKRARQEKGLSVKEVEEKTHIPLYYLQILEGEGDPRLLADMLYLVPFLRTYSAFLGLDPATTVAHFIGAVQKGDAAAAVPPIAYRGLLPRVLTVLVLLAGAVALSVWWFTPK